MKEKIFSVLIGFSFGMIVYSFIGYKFTKNTTISKKYLFKIFLFSSFFLLLVIIYLLIK